MSFIKLFFVIFLPIFISFLIIIVWNNINLNSFKQVKLFIAVLSDRKNFEQRNAIRNSWLKSIDEISNDYIIKTKFVLGNRDCLIHPLDRIDPFDCIPNKFNFQNNENFLIKINKTSSSHLINYKFIFRGFLFKVIYFFN